MASGSRGVAVVTVTYRSTAEIGSFVESVRATRIPMERVVVVDNRSEESASTVERVEALGARVIALDVNRGYGAGVNAGVAVLPASIEYVVISNPDVRVEPDTFDKLVRVLDDDDRVAAVGPKVLNADGSVYPSARRIPSLRTGIGHAVFSRVWPANPWTRRYREEDAPPDEPRDVGWLSGSCLIVRRSAFDQVGGFDDRYFMYFEDVDLGFRFSRAGWRNRYEPSAVVTHIGAISTATARGPMLRTHHSSAYRFLAGKYRGWYLAPVRWSLHLGLNARAWWLTRGML